MAEDDKENPLPEVNEEAKKMAAQRLNDFRRKSMHRCAPMSIFFFFLAPFPHPPNFP